VDLLPLLREGANHHSIRWSIRKKTGDDLKGYNATYHRLRRYLAKAHSDGLLITEKGILDYGMGEKPQIWYRPTAKALGLMRQVQNSNKCKLPPTSTLPLDAPEPGTPEFKKWKRANSWRLIPNRTHPARVNAAKRALAVRNEWDPDVNQKIFTQISTGKRDEKGELITYLNPKLVHKIKPFKDHYRHYLDDINSRSIILLHRDDPERYRELPYRTRFNDIHRQLENLDHYDQAWDEAAEYYSTGVFLTLTTDPSMHADLWHANRHMGKAYNRYTSYLTSKGRKIRKLELKDGGLSKEEIEEEIDLHSFRPKYICVHEFQKNGLIHSHIVFFGISWLDWEDIISADWKRCGQGRVVKACALRKNKFGQWVWSGNPPKDSDGRPPQQYLRKYLQKTIHDQRGFEHYFTINKKFWSRSQRFDPHKLTEEERLDRALKRAATRELKQQVSGSWRFAGTLASDQVPSWLKFLSDVERRRDQQAEPIPVDNPIGCAMNRPSLAYGRVWPLSAEDYLEQTGALRFQTALEIWYEGQPKERPHPYDPGGGAEINPNTGEAYSLGDFI